MPGVCAPCMICHISVKFASSCFIGHVHVIHAYGFSRIPRCVNKCVRPGYFLTSQGISAANHFCAFFPSVWSGFSVWGVLSRIDRASFRSAILHIVAFPKWFPVRIRRSFLFYLGLGRSVRGSVVVFSCCRGSGVGARRCVRIRSSEFF